MSTTAFDEIDKLIRTYEKSKEKDKVDSSIIQRVRYEFFRDFFYTNLLSKDVPLEKRNIFKNKWIEISRGVFNKVYLVDKDDNIVATVPPVMDYLAEVDKQEGLESKYIHASKKDAMLDVGAKDKVFDNQKVNGHTQGYVELWNELIGFIEDDYSKTKKASSPKKKVENVGYEL